MKADASGPSRWRSAGRRLFYPLYFLTLVAVFGVALFPSREAANFLERRLNAAAPGCFLTIAGLSPAFPPALAAAGLEVACRGREVLAATDVRVAPRLAELLAGRLAADVGAALYGGTIRGRIESAAAGNGWKWSARAELAGIDLARAPGMQAWTGHGVSGRLDGTFRLATGVNPAPRLEGALTVRGAVIDPPAPVMTVERLRFDRLAGEVGLDGQGLTVTGGTFKGPQLDGRLAGSVFFSPVPGAARLELEGWARPHPEFLAALGEALSASAEDRRALAQNGFSFRFGGTWDQPQITLAPGTAR